MKVMLRKGGDNASQGHPGHLSGGRSNRFYRGDRREDVWGQPSPRPGTVAKL